MAKLPEWGILNEHEELKHRNALDLNFRPVKDKKLHYMLPDWIESNEVVNLSACGNSQVKILLATVQLLSDKLFAERVMQDNQQQEFEDKTREAIDMGGGCSRCGDISGFECCCEDEEDFFSLIQDDRNPMKIGESRNHLDELDHKDSNI